MVLLIKGGSIMKELFKNDRNFNKDVFEQLGYYVVEHNDLIVKSRHDLTAKELKIMDFVISKIKPDDTEFNTVHTSLYELNKVMDLNIRSGSNYSYMAEKLVGLREKTIAIFEEGNTRAVTFTGWLSDVTVKENGQVSLRLSDKLVPYLLNLKKDYTQYYLHDAAQLNSKYAIMIYKLMREADKSKGKRTPTLTITPDDLKEKLGAPKSYSFGQFNQKVLTPAIEEINLKIEDMDLQVAKGTQGRKVVKLEIYNNFYPRQQTDLIDDEKVPMVDWIKDFK